MVRKMMNTVTIPTELVVVVALMVMTRMMNLTLSLDDALLASHFLSFSYNCNNILNLKKKRATKLHDVDLLNFS